jgi:hypothetical protein
MQTIESGRISSWDEVDNAFANEQEGIATESQQDESLVWNECFDALLRIWHADEQDRGGTFVPPNRIAIEAALTWLSHLRRQFPSLPPTMITAEPAGGIIVERRVKAPNGDDMLSELTFYNDMRAESTFYRNGTIFSMSPLPDRPRSR